MQAGMGITDGIIQGKISCFRNKFHKHKEKCSEKRKFLGALCLRSEKHRRVLLFSYRGNMAFRVVLIENEVTIKVKLNNLIVTKEGEDIWIPLDDISMIVLDNLSSMLSARLLCQLSEQGIGLMICNQKHLPTGYYSSYDNHSRASKVIDYQIEKSKEYYEPL